MNDDFEVVILSACRTPIGSFGGALKDLSAADLGAVVVREAIARAGVAPADVGDVILGCVLQAGAGMNVARQAALKAGLPVEVPAETVNRVCGSGTAGGRPCRRGDSRRLRRHDRRRRHRVDVERAVSAEGRALGLSDGPRRGDRLDARRGADLRDQRLPHGDHRRGDRHPLRRLARRSGRVCGREPAPRRATRSQDGRFKAEIVPVDVPQRKGAPLRVDTDEYPRPGTTVEKLAALKPAFKKDGTVTAGNASGINDGAAALVVTTADKARQIGTPPLARILAYVVHRRRSEDHGHRTGARGPQGARPRRPEDGPTSICSS